MEKLRPLRDRVVLKIIEERVAPQGSLVVVHNADSAALPRKACVVAVGPGKPLSDGRLKPMTAKVGDVVLLGPYTGQKTKVGGEELVIVSEDDLFAKVGEVT